jgi:uncharacterized protein (DUF362 family)
VAALIRDYTGKAKGEAGAAIIRVMEGSGQGDSTATHYNKLKYTLTDIPEVDEFLTIETDSGPRGSGAGQGVNSPGVVKVTLAEFLNKDNNPIFNYRNDGAYYVNKKMYEADALICLPTLKNHWDACITGCIKNIGIGATPASVYSGNTGTGIGRNDMINHDGPNFHNWIADYYTVLPADFAIMDGLQGLEYGPTPCFDKNGIGNIADAQKNMRLILASRDGLALDTVEANVIRWNYDEVKYLKSLTERGQVGVAPKEIKTVRGNPKNITVVGNVKVDDVRTQFRGSLPLNGGAMLTATQLTQPTVNITSAAFSGQNLNIKLDLSANVVKVDIHIDGTYVGSFEGNDITFNPGTLTSGSKQITVHAFSRYMRQNTATTTATK